MYWIIICHVLSIKYMGYNHHMARNPKQRLLSRMAKGQHPGPDDLSVGREEFIQLVQQCADEGLISGAFISFCDSVSPDGILASAVLTDKGREAAGRRRWRLFR